MLEFSAVMSALICIAIKINKKKKTNRKNLKKTKKNPKNTQRTLKMHVIVLRSFCWSNSKTSFLSLHKVVDHMRNLAWGSLLCLSSFTFDN